jgi:SAM-dependent methyltransferase
VTPLDEREDYAAPAIPQPAISEQEEISVSHSRLMPGRFGVRVLTVLLRHPIIAFLIVGFASFFLAFFLIHWANPSTPSHETLFSRFTEESQTTTISLLIALFIVPVVIVVVLRKMFYALVKIARESAERGRAPVLPFLAETVDQMSEQLKELHGEGVELESYQVANWVRRCFQTAGPATRYIGTDSHVPSDYEAVYTDYLKAQKQFLKKSVLDSHLRVMVVDIGTLRSDKFGSGSYGNFVEWHDKNDVTLFQLEPVANKAYLQNEDHHATDLIDIDIGFWENKYVLLFKPVKKKGERERTLLRIAYAGEPLYEKCRAYMKWIEQTAKPIGEELSFYPEKLSAGWEEFCAPSERVKHTMPLIREVITATPKGRSSVIFDAATGIGIETTELIKEGYDVHANEIESSLRDAANAYAQRRRQRIPPVRFHRSDWLHLVEQHGIGEYDIVMVLGNSLCHLEGDAQLEVALHQFARLLAPGGALICDERNFDYIVTNWEKIKADPWNAFRFNQRPAEKRVMYYGDSVLGAPVLQTDKGRIVFEYAHVLRDEDGRIAPEKDGEIGTLSMYPFSKGRLLGSLQGSKDFASVDIYCDLTKAEELDPAADFYTYVAWRPSASLTASGAHSD